MVAEGLVAALARAQAKFPPIEKNRENKHFGSKYADLSAVLAAVRPVLAGEGIAFLQTTEITVVGVELVTSLLSGEERLVSRWPLDINNVGPQQIGSLLSYIRRYQACSLLGVTADDDDDGNAAQTAPRQSFQGLAATDKPADLSKPLSSMTLRELMSVAEQLGHTFTGGVSKAEAIRVLQPLVDAMSGAEPWELDATNGIPKDATAAGSAFVPVVTGTDRKARDSSARADLT